MSDLNRRWTQRDIVTVCALGLAFGVFYLGWVQVWLVAQAAVGPLAMDALMGFWMVGGIVAAYIIRKPFAAFAGETLAAVAEVLTGNPGGLILIMTGVIQGAGLELPFLATRWKRYDLVILILSGIAAAVFSFVYTWVRFDYGKIDTGLLIAMFAIRVTSCVVLGSFLGHWIGNKLNRTGVLDGLAIAHRA
ncbi:ECF transporter S component [Lacibacterium aquatile]|uniref:ECF transporter S component n=1 Tax=Lacibacterium aquatile TaxID=1168082 RepID=A0ABW5DUL1_9PROT